MAILNDEALKALAEIIYKTIGCETGNVVTFLPYDNIRKFLIETHLPVWKADADSLGLPCWEGMSASLISKKPDERQTKEWLTRYLMDLDHLYS